MKNNVLLNSSFLLFLALIAVVLAIGISGCTSDTGTGQNQGSDSSDVSRGEHEREGGEDSGEHAEGGENGEGGEESGTQLALDESYDEVRKGARLIIVYEEQSNSFTGTVENTTSNTLKQVRVEVHLSNGVELGPTTPEDLVPGGKIKVMLQGTSQTFDGWTPHAEVGAGPGEGGGEHDGEGGS